MEHERLTGDVGAGLDPCAALQVVVEIEPGHTAEMTFLLGQADDEEKARALVNRFRDPANVEAAFQETRRWWDRAPEHDRSGNAGAFHEFSAQPLAALPDAQLPRLGPLGALSIERRLRIPRPIAGCDGARARRARNRA